MKMQGKIIHYSEQSRSGLISGEDGHRYSFLLSAWIDKGKPRPGMAIDFQCKGREVFCVCPATPA